MTGHLIAVVLILAVLITPTTGALARALPPDRQPWWLGTWLASAVLLWFTPKPVLAGFVLAAAILIAAVVLAQRDPTDDDYAVAEPSLAFPQPQQCEACGNRQNWRAIWRRPRGGEPTVIAWVCQNCGHRVSLTLKKRVEFV